jgi:membrane protein DedA with SNARE-associated domain
VLLAAAINAGTTHQLAIALIIIAAAMDSILGNLIGFLLGSRGGYRLLDRYGHFLPLDERNLKLGQYLFLRHGG